MTMTTMLGRGLLHPTPWQTTSTQSQSAKRRYMNGMTAVVRLGGPAGGRRNPNFHIRSVWVSQPSA